MTWVRRVVLEDVSISVDGGKSFTHTEQTFPLIDSVPKISRVLANNGPIWGGVVGYLDGVGFVDCVHWIHIGTTG